MRRLLVWFLLLNKRLFHKWSFCLVLALLPVLLLAMKVISEKDSGMLTIAVAAENPKDSFSAEAISKLEEYKGVLRYVYCEEEEGHKLLAKGQVDALWVFPERLWEKLKRGAEEETLLPAVKIYQREKSTALYFSREVVANAVYPAFSYLVYRDYLINHLGLSDLTEEQLQEIYQRYLWNGNLFEMTYSDGGAVEESNYLMAPMRGILAVWLLLLGFLAVLYDKEDVRKGIYLWFPAKNKPLRSLFAQSVLMVDGLFVLLLACLGGGIMTALWREVLCAFLFGVCVMVFCNVMGFILQKPERLCACIPVVLFGMLLLNPIFVNLREYGRIRYAFPVIYYLRSIHNETYMWAMAAYGGVGFGIFLVLSVYKGKKHEQG